MMFQHYGAADQYAKRTSNPMKATIYSVPSPSPSQTSLSSSSPSSSSSSSPSSSSLPSTCSTPSPSSIRSTYSSPWDRCINEVCAIKVRRDVNVDGGNNTWSKNFNGNARGTVDILSSSIDCSNSFGRRSPGSASRNRNRDGSHDTSCCQRTHKNYQYETLSMALEPTKTTSTSPPPPTPQPTTTILSPPSLQSSSPSPLPSSLTCCLSEGAATRTTTSGAMAAAAVVNQQQQQQPSSPPPPTTTTATSTNRALRTAIAITTSTSQPSRTRKRLSVDRSTVTETVGLNRSVRCNADKDRDRHRDRDKGRDRVNGKGKGVRDRCRSFVSSTALTVGVPATMPTIITPLSIVIPTTTTTVTVTAAATTTTPMTSRIPIKTTTSTRTTKDTVIKRPNEENLSNRNRTNSCQMNNSLEERRCSGDDGSAPASPTRIVVLHSLAGHTHSVANHQVLSPTQYQQYQQYQQQPLSVKSESTSELSTFGQLACLLARPIGSEGEAGRLDGDRCDGFNQKIISQTTIFDTRCFMENSDMDGDEITDNNNHDNNDNDANDGKVREDVLPKPSEPSIWTMKGESIVERKPLSEFPSQHQSGYLPTKYPTGYRWQLPMSFGKQQLTQLLSGSKFLSMLMVVFALISSANCWAGRQDAVSNCTFPPHWEGSWFLSGSQHSIHIKGSQFSYRGKCAASDGNKYLIVDEKGCHRCLVIYEKHTNVLQYKESECEGDSMYMHQSNPSAMAMRNADHTRGGAHPNSNGHSRLSSSDQYIMRSNDDMNDYYCRGRETLQNLCDQIPGDALLYSLFRESAEPVKCPLKGPYAFTYNRGHGECKYPLSNIESCTEDSRLLLSFQACPDVIGTESTLEELTCLATWKDGNARYMVGLVSHHHAISNEERYRCFVYEKISPLMGGPSISGVNDAEYKLAQSGDATCNGLDSAEVGSRIMSLRKPVMKERCDFPAWFKGPRHWHALMGNAVYTYHHSNTDNSIQVIKPNGYMETRALCEQINKQTSTEMMAVVQFTTGCQSGFMCMMFYRRDTHVVEIQTGKPASRLEDACAPGHFDVNKMPYITLLTSSPDPQICPMEGIYNLRTAIGPPYVPTRHKRNHNNKLHNTHGHHHHNDGANATPGNVIGYKRHEPLSFRGAGKVEKTSWHANTKGLSARMRRAATSIGSTGSSHSHSQSQSPSPTPSPLPSPSYSQSHSHSNTNTNSKSVVDQTASGVHDGNVSVKQLLLNATTTRNETSLLEKLDWNGQLERNRREVPVCVTNYKANRQLWIGCTEPNVIDVRPVCSKDGEEEYSCHGSWSENGTVYTIARHKASKHGVCISYRPSEGNAAKLVIGDACYRGTQNPPEHHLVADLLMFGKCGETGTASMRVHIYPQLAGVLIASLTTLVSQLLANNGAVTLLRLSNIR